MSNLLSVTAATNLLSVSRQVKGSNNRKKALKKLAKAHYRVACIRKDATHKLTSYLAKNHSEVVIEDLKLSERTFICSSCGFLLDRDLNAAINLSKAGSSPVSACGVSDQRSTSVGRTRRSRKKT